MNSDEERWVPVVGFEGFYEISDHGNVRSIDRVTRTMRGWTQRFKGRPMKTHSRPKGHQWVPLQRPGQPMTHQLVHRAVLEAFVGPCPDGMMCRHLDGDPRNNRLDNLAWGTYSENMQDCLTHRTHGFASRTHCKWGHEYTPENTRWRYRPEIQCKARVCVECAKKSNRKRAA